MRHLTHLMHMCHGIYRLRMCVCHSIDSKCFVAAHQLGPFHLQRAIDASFQGRPCYTASTLSHTLAPIVCVFQSQWKPWVCFGPFLFVFRCLGTVGLLWFCCCVFRLFGFRLVCFGSFVFRWLGAVGLLWFRCCVFRLFGFRLVCFGSFVFRWLGAVGLLWFRSFWFSICLVSAWFALGLLFFFFPLAGCGWFALVLLFFVFRLFGVRLVCFGSFVFRWLGTVGLQWFHCFLFSVCLVCTWFALVLLFSVGWVRLVCFGSVVVFSVCLVSAWFALVLLFSVGWVRLVCFGSVVCCFPFVWFPLGLLGVHVDGSKVIVQRGIAGIQRWSNPQLISDIVASHMFLCSLDVRSPSMLRWRCAFGSCCFPCS